MNEAFYYFDELTNKGISFELCDSVHDALYKKRQGKSEVDVDLDKMAVYFNSDYNTLATIIRWYENNLISTKFKIKCSAPFFTLSE